VTADEPPEVTVVVPVLDGAAVLGGCLDALAAQRGPSFEVVVVDNGSRDGSAELARRHPLAPRVVHEPRRGSYAARNAGIRAARAGVVAFTDADCRPEPDWLHEALSALADADLVGGAVEAVVSARPTVWERYDRATYLDQERTVRDESYAATANLVVRAEVLRAVGGFDPALASSGDLDLGRRATATGYRLVHAPRARVRHVARRTARQSWRLNRRLGAGWRDLARRGQRPVAWREPALRVPLRWAVGRVRADGLGGGRVRPALVHATVLAARWTGRLLGDRRR